ncbi:transcription termination factor NusA [Acidipropionibacterium jensenii]|uniref:transcription termination factor NusA n=1 Tax=Acidipropionibacterium jensenii TaxID=1749 RepID=UPI000BC2E020|nr:transcription termination factor NusA [Acidipropionibacterium jensenii]AZZ42447.1 transcription termination/antitermination protein NusA [Acidipropionibacterium jensenii]MDN5977934.1 transcription termination factor NusA [Acidipropionibacterium jensenii]MDN6427761.1 transcription termination factor NusA [Acidipropionibacterium jensenii]MDN6441629.1 transcription termination factor NusA [Acidipropionibacterium jensenii]MDN6480286.1 transcription termination factor NusA [Acidipropionibacteriu
MDIDLAALRMIEREKEIPLDYLVETLEDALLNAYAKTEHPVKDARVELDRKTGNVAVMVPERNEEEEIVGWYDGTPSDFGRVAASTARQVIFQRLREAEDEQKYGQFQAVEGDVVTGVVQQSFRDTRTVHVDLGAIEAIMPPAEQVPGEKYTHGRRLRVYVVAVRKELRGPQVVVSRTHPNLVRKLFALEVPEIEQGVVEIKALAREAGHRSKIAVTSHNPDVSAKGACIGPMGQRVRAVMHELDDEKIDIIDWSEDPATFVGAALSPAKVKSVTVVDPATRATRVVVPDYQLSLAIGREGQNARLANRLTGWRIDIVPDNPVDTAGPATTVPAQQ